MAAFKCFLKLQNRLQQKRGHESILHRLSEPGNWVHLKLWRVAGKCGDESIATISLPVKQAKFL
jgi:hypothetical protein